MRHLEEDTHLLTHKLTCQRFFVHLRLLRGGYAQLALLLSWSARYMHQKCITFSNGRACQTCWNDPSLRNPDVRWIQCRTTYKNQENLPFYAVIWTGIIFC